MNLSTTYYPRIATLWRQHIIFWCAWYFLNVVIWTFQNSFYHFLVVLNDVLFSYILVYILIPIVVRKKRYILFIASLSLLTAATFYYLRFLFLFGKFRGPMSVANWTIFLDIVSHTFVAGILFYTMTVISDLLHKNIEQTTLMSENAKAELELLKSRIHPHFLFNTLNNIYSFILNKSPQASAHLMKLSDMLRYMVTECHQPMVPLEKEITMIQNYFGLEQTRYGNHLDVQVDIKGESREMFIAPLLLIPFVENSFKHGTSKMLNRPWIKLSIDIQHEQLQLSLINSKPVRNQEDLAKGGIGLTNVKKRLRILYPGEHQLKLESASDYFGVYLQVPLIRSDAMPPPTTRST